MTNAGSNAPSHAWWYLTRRMNTFIANLAVTDLQDKDGRAKQAGVRAVLNRHYYGVDSETANSMLTGGWGKHLRVRPPRDVDVLFSLPWDVHQRFEARSGNIQSQLLQEVKAVLGGTYTESDMGGDGQVVVVRFASMPVEVVPAFEFADGKFWICDTNDGGSYRLTDPRAEMAELDHSDLINQGATRRLIRMLKQWQRHCSVPLKSYVLERLAIELLQTWPYARDIFWFDWLIRDFFAYLVSRANGAIIMPGTGQWVLLGEDWASKARSAHAAAVRACDYERDNENILAGAGWQSLFGAHIPMYVD
jgi:hypothetical protein